MHSSTLNDAPELHAAGLAVLCNPRSGRVRTRLDQVRAWLRAVPDVSYREGSEPEDISVAVRELLAEAREALFVVGGDGTLQAVLTALAEHAPTEQWPALSVIPAGTTNMTAKDLGMGGGVSRRVAALRAWAERRGGGERRIERAVLRVEGSDGVVRCGMFFGAGAVSVGVGFFRDRLYHKGLYENQTSALSVAWVLLRLALGGREAPEMSLDMRCQADGRSLGIDGAFFCLASTLEKLILGVRPHWGEGDGPVRFTLAERDSTRFWTSLPSLARGRPGDRLTPEHGYHSLNAKTLTLTFDGEYVVDGELYRARADQGPVRISAITGVEWLIV